MQACIYMKLYKCSDKEFLHERAEQRNEIDHSEQS